MEIPHHLRPTPVFDKPHRFGVFFFPFFIELEFTVFHIVSVASSPSTGQKKVQPHLLSTCRNTSAYIIVIQEENQEKVEKLGDKVASTRRGKENN